MSIELERLSALAKQLPETPQIVSKENYAADSDSETTQSRSQDIKSWVRRFDELDS